MTSKFLDFEMELQYLPVRLNNKDGSVRWIAIQEITGSQKTSWLNSMRQKQKIKNGEVVGIRDFKGIQEKLLGMVTYNVEVDLNVDKDTGEETVQVVSWGEKLTEKEITNLPTRIQDSLFKEVQVLSGMSEDKKDGDEEGNE